MASTALLPYSIMPRWIRTAPSCLSLLSPDLERANSKAFREHSISRSRTASTPTILNTRYRTELLCMPDGDGFGRRLTQTTGSSRKILSSLVGAPAEPHGVLTAHKYGVTLGTCKLACLVLLSGPVPAERRPSIWKREGTVASAHYFLHSSVLRARRGHPHWHLRCLSRWCGIWGALGDLCGDH